MDAAIARSFLVPPSIVNVLAQSSLTYSTTAEETRRWLALALYPGYLARIEAAFSDFTPRGQVCVFDTSNLLRTDYSARVTTGGAAVAAGLITPEEWRAQEGLPPLPNASPVTLSPTVEGI
jgi:phage portal protein BeeE